MVQNVSKPKNVVKPKGNEKSKELQKPQGLLKTKEAEKPKGIEKAKKVEKAPAKDNGKKKPNRIARFWRSTIGELRKVTWPTPTEAWRLTKIVLMVVLAMAAILGLLDFVFSRLIGVLVSI